MDREEWLGFGVQALRMPFFRVYSLGYNVGASRITILMSIWGLFQVACAMTIQASQGQGPSIGSITSKNHIITVSMSCPTFFFLVVQYWRNNIGKYSDPLGAG